MTRDKAIEEVKNYENYPNGLSKECRDYIVKALEQVPSSLVNPNLSENPISSITKNGISNRTIIYKAKESKDIQEDLEKLEKLNDPTIKNCESCRHYGLHHEICNYCYKCSLWKKKEPTTKNDCIINGLDDFIEFGKKAFGIELTVKKSDNPDTYAKLFGTTKNDLGVREFEEIVVEYPPEDLFIYPEYKGKPYFSIKYKEGNDYFIGYGTYNPKVFSRYLRDYFMPSVTPQEPRWVPVSEKMPKDSEPVNIIWRSYCHFPYFRNIRDKAFTATGVYSNGQWHWWSKSCTDILAEYSHNYADIIDDAIEVEAWMPCYDDIMDDDIDVLAWMALPESYKAESEK